MLFGLLTRFSSHLAIGLRPDSELRSALDFQLVRMRQSGLAAKIAWRWMEGRPGDQSHRIFVQVCESKMCIVFFRYSLLQQYFQKITARKRKPVGRPRPDECSSGSPLYVPPGRPRLEPGKSQHLVVGGPHNKEGGFLDFQKITASS